ncbi:Hypothetical_protein [Hexamita inflata]|uniref:Hypothetical_protein n=1 Tax=Hexamita inflata TaxID=28002 RepID=A0ABP1HHL2_9EUKA
MNIQYLVDVIALKFNMQPCDDLERRVALQVIMLPEQHLMQLFVQLSYDLNIDSLVLKNFFMANILPQISLNTSISFCQQVKFKATGSRQKTQSHLELPAEIRVGAQIGSLGFQPEHKT